MNTRAAVLLAFLAAFLAVGLHYWYIPYSKASLPSSLYSWHLLIVPLLTAVLRVSFGASFMQACGTVGLAVPAMIMARVAVETSRDPTSHNLWPFEVAIATGVGLAAAVIGALLGGILLMALKLGKHDEGDA